MSKGKNSLVQLVMTMKKAPEGAYSIQNKDTNNCSERQSFVFYRSFSESIKMLPMQLRLPLYEAITDFGLNGQEPTFEDFQDKYILCAVWVGMRPQLEANRIKWENACKGAPFGVKGGAPKGNQNARKSRQNNPKTTPNVNVNDNDNVDNCHYPYNPCKTFEPVLPGYHPMTKEDLQ